MPAVSAGLMAILIGTDEAGYGPNLGPLVVSATMWHVPDEFAHADFYQTLSDFVVRPFDKSPNDARVVIGDSKQLYSPANGLAQLECGVLAALGVLKLRTKTWREVWQALDSAADSDLVSRPWYKDFDARIPCGGDADRVQEACRLLKEGCEQAGIACLAVRSAAVFPARFNQLVDELGNKATVLSTVTLELISKLLEGIGGEQIFVHCDKHGGRNNYASLLQHTFADDWIEVRNESRDASVYRWGPPNRRVEIRFVKGGESFLPAALASMTAKYLRELAMRAFNEYWQRHIPNLKPTAGYPVDARRFKAEIQIVQQQLGIADDLLWRRR